MAAILLPMIPFSEFPKMARLSRECLITEKIDGTNAQILITEDGQFLTGSRNRWITPQDDNFGFSRWAHDNKEALIKGLGVGQHFGEWWGAGIQRRYGQTTKHFSLFNVTRWGFLNEVTPEQNPLAGLVRVVPVLYRGIFSSYEVDTVLKLLKSHGSQAAPGFSDPEGIVIYHEAARVGFKKTIKDDASPKSLAKAA